MEKSAVKDLLKKEISIYKNLGSLEYEKVQKEIENVLEIPFKHEIRNTSMGRLELAFYLVDDNGNRISTGSVDVYQYGLDSEVKLNYGCTGSFTSKDTHKVNAAMLIYIIASKLESIEYIIATHKKDIKEIYEYLDKLMDDLADIEMDEEIEEAKRRNEAIDAFISINAKSLVMPSTKEVDDDGIEHTTYKYPSITDKKGKYYGNVIKINFLKPYESGWKVELIKNYGNSANVDLNYSELHKIFNWYQENKENANS